MDKQIAVQPIYDGLIGILGNAPSQGLIAKEVWTLYNWYIKKLEEVTDSKYDVFNVVGGDYTGNAISSGVLRPTLNSLINYLHGEYFPNEPLPFSGAPAVSFTNSMAQQQSQELHIAMAQEITSLVEKEVSKHPVGTPERSFLDNIKTQINTAKNIVDIIQLILQTANSVGLDLTTLGTLFPH